MEEAVHRNIVIGFFQTIYWSCRFRRERSAQGASRMGAPPQIPVPEIFVEDPDDEVTRGEGILPRDFTEAAPATSLQGTDRASSSSGYDAGRASSMDHSLRRRDSRSNSPTRLNSSPTASPHLAAQQLGGVDTSYHGAGNGPRLESRGRLTPSHSPSHSPTHSRQGSSVSASGVLASLDNSAWGESIRRSFTLRRPNSTSHG